MRRLRAFAARFLNLVPRRVRKRGLQGYINPTVEILPLVYCGLEKKYLDASRDLPNLGSLFSISLVEFSGKIHAKRTDRHKNLH